MNLREVFEDLHRSQEAREGRVYYSVTGQVTDAEDPTSNNFLGRVKARIASQGDNESTDWLSPMWQGGIESIPRKGDQVLVSFQDGDPHRGYYSWHPDKSTKNRASEYAVLGNTLAGMWNALITAIFSTFQTQYNAHQHTYIYGTTAVPVSPWNATGGHMQDASGAQIADKSGDGKVLSKLVKIVSGF